MQRPNFWTGLSDNGDLALGCYFSSWVEKGNQRDVRRFAERRLFMRLVCMKLQSTELSEKEKAGIWKQGLPPCHAKDTCHGFPEPMCIDAGNVQDSKQEFVVFEWEGTQINIQAKPVFVLYLQLPTSTHAHTQLPTHMDISNLLGTKISKYTLLIEFTLQLWLRS